MSKPIEDSFADWEGSTFGFGYGTGEAHVIPVLRAFFANCLKTDDPSSRSYDHEVLEETLSPPVAWLLINALCHVDIIEYGTSPRFGWLTPSGERLRDFVLSKSNDELYAMTSRSEDYSHCYPDACNCGPNGYQAGVKCDNPFWRKP